MGDTLSTPIYNKPYIGRFAPSPSGPLHFGSLVAALASYLDARVHQGKWLVRMEDIDPPREQPGAADLILNTLEAYGLQWDGSVLFQSNRSEAYDETLNKLLREKKLYPCTCTRKRLAGLNGVYPGYCRKRHDIPNQPHGLRLLCNDKIIQFRDRIQGEQSFDLSALGDFILKRKDGLYAYQLAVCVDDHFQGITHIVRGVDLLDSTPRQLYLQSQLDYPHPDHAHIPVITQSSGNKLSKQNHAPAIPLDNPRPILIRAFAALGLQPKSDLMMSSVEEILNWGIQNWSFTNIRGKQEILQDS
ncbi:tRNA glutamyl-Q(34) synthetase GluQRS [Endozoicomonas sp.]|uniref:tRNA glutamyl-Q(34) synthetase GluQRS n=1 Tax=Endozoicomonas sp. TaxID=1892382 RepID=UPI003839D8DB